MLVSNFELISTPREHSTYQDTTYELLITNIADIQIEFLVQIHASVYQLQYGSVSLADLYIEVMYADSNADYVAYKDDLEYVRPVYLIIPSKATALIKIHPPVEREIMGYITLRVPPVKNRTHFLITTQQSSPVKVLLSATRQDFCRSFVADIRDENGKPVYKTFINNWLSRQSVPLASGQACNEIEPEGIGLATRVSEVLNLSHLHDALKQQMIQETTASST